jgi:hypothetical protein
MRKPREAYPGGVWVRVLSYRPSASMIVALIALFVAMGGTTYAVKRLPKRSVGSAQIKSKAVIKRTLRARNVTRTKIARNAIDSGLVQRDALRGSDILESSLSDVPSAVKATTADEVDGFNIERFSLRVAAGTASANLLMLGGLSLSAGCNAGPALAVTASTAVNNANIHSGGTIDAGTTDTAFAVEDDDFDVGESFNPFPASHTNLTGSIVYARQDGNIVTIDFLAEEVAPGGCVFAGTAIG